MASRSFGKVERLAGRKAILHLFRKGSSFTTYPYRVIWMANADVTAGYHQILVSAPRRSFPRAVTRNLLKRRTREAYRLEKQQLAGKPKLLIAFVYTARDLLQFAEIRKGMSNALMRLQDVAGNKS